ncbi:C6 transcription factor [Geosmithia morbida]|uniref:C6 transcription factor n=1 Tax=Geosmithia morbida TaxID=1094350 RepID=A0A9P5D037_9HYPO|nr:C6 transcription factor [Geosmithia morbida]KAF4122313.1 C6 transcription factor [Geosmithia morbida]
MHTGTAKDDQGSGGGGNSDGLPRKRRTRTRTGCLNCRRKKRKCDERRPTCGTCSRRAERCEWGVKITFRRENAQCLDGRHPSMQKIAGRKRPRGFEILDVTAEVIRDYDLPSPTASDGGDGIAETPAPEHSGSRLPSSVTFGRDEKQSIRLDEGAMPSAAAPSSAAGYLPPTLMRSPQPPAGHSDSDVANLMFLSRGGRPGASRAAAAAADYPVQATLDSVPIDMIADYMTSAQALTPEGSFEDGVFMPGSAYHELHSTLRHHLIQEVRSNAPTRSGTPETGAADFAGTDRPLWPSAAAVATISAETSSILRKDEEIVLWRNWFGEIAPWLDKFDRDAAFQNAVPHMAASHDHLRYSLLALSARQLELKETTQPTDRSLTLYQQAIHLLLPHLPSRSTAVIASCVILCVLEMLSCSPKAWRRHLDGCASLMQAVGMNGAVGGVEESLFWCFARMDVCGGLISSVKTLIPADQWATKMDLDTDVSFYRSQPGFHSWANYMVYLVAQVLDLLAPVPTEPLDVPSRTDPKFRTRWIKLWGYIWDWHHVRPAPLHSIMTIPSSEDSPFPTILFSNPAAISGNQLYHTASILMLQNHPPGVSLSPKPRSILWHARQVCAISISNDHHGAWTNGIQPLWIAGRCMSHPAEHRAILELLDKIERESGWGTRWRAADLREYWGDLGE